MNPRSLVFRLVAWHAMWLAAVFLMAGVLLFFGLRHYLEGNLADTQMKRAQRIALLITPAQMASPEELSRSITKDFAPEASERFIRVSEEGVGVVYQSGQPHDKSFDSQTVGPFPGRAGIRVERPADGGALMIASVASRQAQGRQFFVETGESLTPAFRELHRLLGALAVGFVVVAIVGIVGGHRLIKGALRPIEEITIRAETITSRNLSERLPVPKTGAEFEHLSHALNRMILRLDEAFQHNRRFLADASHELRTPLTILRGELESLSRAPGLTDGIRETAESLFSEVDRLTHIVENLFALSRLEAGLAQVKHDQLDLAQLAAATAEQMCLLAEDKNITIQCKAAAPVFVEGDRARLKQVVVNLLDNAIKYTPNGGMVTLSVTAAGNQAVCEVTDTGIGIPAEAIPMLFDRFFRVDEARSRQIDGVGLGLAIVKSICTAHCGAIEVESEVGQGSRFRIKLPLTPAQSLG